MYLDSKFWSLKIRKFLQGGSFDGTGHFSRCTLFFFENFTCTFETPLFRKKEIFPNITKIFPFFPEITQSFSLLPYITKIFPFSLKFTVFYQNFINKTILFSKVWTYTRAYSMNEIPHRLDLWTDFREMKNPRVGGCAVFDFQSRLSYT